MKWLLVLSLVMNGILGWKLLTQKEVVREEIVEKVVVRKAEPEIIEKKVIVEVPKEKTEENISSGPVEFDEKDMNDSVDEVTHDREEYLQSQLQLNEKDLKAIENVKQRYMQRFSQVVPQSQRGAITLDQRKKILALEEQRDAEFANIMGQKKWDSFTKFRDDYNQKMYKKGIKEKGIIVPMEI